jgi:hypothetical protein
MSFEEVTALNAATERLLSSPDGGGVAAPPEVLAELEVHLPARGDISIMTLAQQRRLVRGPGLRAGAPEAPDGRADRGAVRGRGRHGERVLRLRERADAAARVDAIGREMVALIELMTGSDPTRRLAEQVTFLD